MDAMLEPQRKQQSPFMKLPTELRVVIYHIVLDDLVHTITELSPQRPYSPRNVFKSPPVHTFTTTPYSAPEYWDHKGNRTTTRPRFLGSLALLHINSTIRAESADAMLSRIGAYCNAVEIELESATHAYRVALFLASPGGQTPNIKRLDYGLGTAINHHWKLLLVRKILKEITQLSFAESLVRAAKGTWR